MTQALLLDALGTLVELPAPGPALREELAERFGLRVSEAQASAALVAEIAFYRRHFDLARDPESLAALRGRCAEVLREALPPSPRLAALGTPELTAALLGALRFAPYPDALPAIRAARERGLRVVVASNWDVSLPDVLRRVGLAPVLDGVVTSAAAGERKPGGAVFRRALELAGGVSPAAAVHVGDSPEEDVVGAHAAGLRAILIRREGGPGPPGVPTIERLSELSGLL
ncbi:MAG TPA: HAD family hydrolase [Solirubrobacteraceae bacterium]|nr:HAD family hydrolase [Solirubrobacteraceae bacterium]